MPDKIESVTKDGVILNYAGNWYNIPATALITLKSVRDRYGLKPTVDSATFEDNRTIPYLEVNNQLVLPPSPWPMPEEVKNQDMVTDLRLRWENIQTPVVRDLKRLIAMNLTEWAPFLPQYEF